MLESFLRLTTANGLRFWCPVYCQLPTRHRDFLVPFLLCIPNQVSARPPDLISYLYLQWLCAECKTRCVWKQTAALVCDQFCSMRHISNQPSFLQCFEERLTHPSKQVPLTCLCVMWTAFRWHLYSTNLLSGIILKIVQYSAELRELLDSQFDSHWTMVRGFFCKAIYVNGSVRCLWYCT